MDWPLKFGIFLAPFHPVGQNPTLALERDLELVERLDELGFDEAWFGEHHSAGYEIIASPEVFIAVAAERTKNIRLGTGVSSLPYHHPLILADRMVLLDHLTRGRVMFGVGPGALPSDAFMMGIDTSRQREMMEESLEAILLLLTTDEPVNVETDWFTLRRRAAATAPVLAPAFRDRGRRAGVARRAHGWPDASASALLSIGATSTGGFDVLGSHWTVMEERAAEFGQPVDRRNWRLVGPMHIAETEEQARGRGRARLAAVDGLLPARRRAAPRPGQRARRPIDDRRDERIGHVRDRHARAGDRPDPAPDRPVRRLRHLPLHGPRVGRPGGDAAQLRAVRARGHAALPGPDGPCRHAHATGPPTNRPEFIGAATTAVMKAFQDHNEEKAAKAEAKA